ncbi:NADH-quinone oxidoreductase subunit L [Chitinimonas sp.]|uniref:NADH-quinone oxidoreductase subunit L n=1 Tax=Chitinimonas sp. TaxID=1934313 RepID=UPI0035B3898D
MPHLIAIQTILALLPLALMLLMGLLAYRWPGRGNALWPAMLGASALATVAAAGSLACVLLQQAPAPMRLPGLALGLTVAWFALLVQGLAWVIAGFSARYLEGEAGQPAYVAALAGVIGAVHLLVLADHWLLLIAAWAAVGMVLQRLLCFYGDRPFAVLAAHKKFLADRLADVLLLLAAWLAVGEVGSASISGLFDYVAIHGANASLQASAILLAVAVAIRCALLPLHGWLIQVMEAPTPVSALLHAGVVNLGGLVLIRFAPLLEAVPAARTLLVLLGLATAVLAGFVMLTRISIKVRQAWSTVAQMGFMVLECGLGLYQLAALHLIGHSLYKAHAFLSAADTVRQARLADLRGSVPVAGWSLLAAPVLALALLLALTQGLALVQLALWPWWWSAILALAWAPLLWVAGPAPQRLLASGLAMLAGLGASAALAHWLPLGAANLPHDGLGWLVLAVLAVVYLGSAALQRPAWRQALEPLRRQSYAGFYLDEAYTRLTLRLWPVALPAAASCRDARCPVLVRITPSR